MPVAGATHWTLYRAGVDDSAGRTSEDDGRVITAPGTFLHGRQNAVVESGHVPGDGGLFVDARVGNAVAGTDLYAGALVGAGRDQLVAGFHEVSVWYGQWSDLDRDGAIDDVQDASCGAGACPDDEFRWRGLATGEDGVLMFIYHIPNPTGVSIGPPRIIVPTILSGYANPTSYKPDPVADLTSTSNEEQAWVGYSTVRADHGFLTTAQTLTIAGAKKVVGGQAPVDFDDPAALIDVDVYEAVSPEVEFLYRAAIATHYAATDPIAEIYPQVTEIVGNSRPDVPNAADVLALAAQVSQTAQGIAGDPVLAARKLYIAADPKEPNHPLDDFEGRATYGGVGDALGSYNAYGAYADGFHLYLDTVPRTAMCAGLYANLPDPGGESTNGACAQFAQLGAARASQADPFGAQRGNQRTAGNFVIFQAHFFLWHDLNADTHVGAECDPTDPGSFDAERNTCRTPRYPWPHWAVGEMRDICTAARGKGTSFTLTPVGAEWSRVIVLRHAHQTTRVAFEPESIEVPSGSESITLWWRDTCEGVGGDSPALRARDLIGFLDGSNRFPILVRSEVSLAGYKDAALGIDVGPEYVVDYDLLAAAL